MSLAVRSGIIDRMSFYICKTDRSGIEYKATVSTIDGPQERVCPSFEDAVSWVNAILEKERENKDEVERN